MLSRVKKTSGHIQEIQITLREDYVNITWDLMATYYVTETLIMYAPVAQPG